MFFIFGFYSYAFFIGALFVKDKYINPVEDRPYTGSDVIVCFFGVLFGMFSLGLTGPSFTAIA